MEVNLSPMEACPSAAAARIPRKPRAPHLRVRALYLRVALALVAVTALAGCGSSSSGSNAATPSSSVTSSTSTGAAPTGSTIDIGVSTALSGPISAIQKPYVAGLQAWVDWINAKGGIKGHPIKLHTYDNALDPARHLSNLRTAVEQDHVVAFLGNVPPGPDDAARKYLLSKQVPDIANNGASEYDSPIEFPAASSPTYSEPITFSSNKGASGLKIGLFWCTEAPSCKHTNEAAPSLTKQFDEQYVFNASVSTTQADFTSQCLAAKAAKVETAVVVTDPNSVQRIAAACARQGLNPKWSMVYTVASPAMQTDTNLNKNFSAYAFNFLPFQDNTPATEEFQQAWKTYGSGDPVVGSSTGWLEGKLFEAAATKSSDPSTGAGILDGLWQIKDNDLGGLTAPLTFAKNQNATPNQCWWNVTIKDNKFVSPDNFKRNCINPPVESK
jgi:branched-chain amino acid transport system substrate-binding protein